MRQKITVASSIPNSSELKGGHVSSETKVQDSSEVKSSVGFDLPESIQMTGCNNDPCKDYTCIGACKKTDQKLSHGCAKINENSNGGSSLRYAFHLRFLCPCPKKSSKSFQRCKSDRDGDRRFYLYNDLRVVFPQRHSDGDEGKVMSFTFF